MPIHDPIFIKLTPVQSGLLGAKEDTGRMPKLNGDWDFDRDKQEMTFMEWEDARDFAAWARDNAKNNSGKKYKQVYHTIARKVEKSIEFPKRIEEQVKSGQLVYVSNGHDQQIVDKETDLQVCQCGTTLRMVAPNIGWCDNCEVHKSG